MQATITEQLPCKLTEREKLLKSDQMAHAHGEIKRLEEAKKLSGAQYKSSIDAKKDLVTRLAKEIETGEEIRPIECVEVPRYKERMVDIKRLDSGVVISSRPMAPHEHQAKLALDEPRLKKTTPPMPKRGKGGKFEKGNGKPKGKTEAQGKGETEASSNAN